MKSLPFCILILSLGLSGCTWLAPEYHRPAFVMPDKWPSSEAAQREKETAIQQWWQSYQDPTLTKLINEALGGNSDVAVASARLMQTKAQYDYATANRLPLVGLLGLHTRSQIDFGENPLFSNTPGNNGFTGGLLTYEIDLWGKQASAQQAAFALYRGQSYYRDAVRLSVSAATAQLYFNILALENSLRVMQELVDTEEEMHQLAAQQFEAGATPEISLRIAEAQLAARTAELPKISDQLEKAEGALATLLGRSPQQILAATQRRGKNLDSLPVPPITPEDLPSDLLLRRPDLAALEQMLIASNFNVGYARAAYFPTISLVGLLGVTSLDIDNIYKGSVRTWALGGSIVGPLADFGRTGSGVDLALAKNQEQLARYKAGVQTAFKEVRDALSSQRNLQIFERELHKKEGATTAALNLISQRFSLGFANYGEILSMRRSCQEARLAMVTARLYRLNGSVDLFKALGGGWRMPNEKR